MKYLLLLLCFLCPAFSHAAIAFDNAQDGGQSTSVTSPVLTFSKTNTGTNLTLLVFCTTGNVVTQDDAITGVTYNSVAMTRVNFSPFVTNVGPFYAYILINPATGANNVVATGATEGTNYRIFCSSTSYTGTDQTAYDAKTTNSALTATTFNTSLSSVADLSWHIIGVGYSLGSVSAGTATTLRSSGSAVTFIDIYDSNSAKTPAGSVTLQETGISQNWNASMITLRPPQPVAAASFNPWQFWDF